MWPAITFFKANVTIGKPNISNLIFFYYLLFFFLYKYPIFSINFFNKNTLESTFWISHRIIPIQFWTISSPLHPYFTSTNVSFYCAIKSTFFLRSYFFFPILFKIQMDRTNYLKNNETKDMFGVNFNTPQKCSSRYVLAFQSQFQRSQRYFNSHLFGRQRWAWEYQSN